MSEKNTIHTIGLDSPVFAGRLRAVQSAPQKPVAAKPQPELSYRAWLDVSVPQVAPKVMTQPQPQPVAPKIEAPAPIEIPKQAVLATPAPDFVKNAEAYRNTAVKARMTRQKITSWALMGLAAVLFVFGSYVALQAFFINKKFEGPTAQAAAAPADDRDESEPSQEDIMGYKVGPDEPRFIRIAKFDAFSRVLQMGADEKGQMETPGNIFDAGWYDQSVLPGSGSGAAVIGGHVSGPTKGGVFEKLDQLVPGDEIEIERGNGQKVTYQVVSSESKPLSKVDMQKAMNPAVAEKEGLTLITCSGALDDSGQHYKDRLLVYAVVK